MENSGDLLPLDLEQREAEMVIDGPRTHLQEERVTIETTPEQANMSLIGFLSAVRKCREQGHLEDGKLLSDLGAGLLRTEMML